MEKDLAGRAGLQKKRYIDAIMRDLVEHLDFIPPRDKEGRYATGGSIGLLEKLDISTFSIVQIIDGDAFSKEKIIYHLRKSVQYLDMMASNRVEKPEMTMVFVFDFLPDAEKYRAVTEHLNSAGRLSVYIVVISEGFIEGHGTGYSADAMDYVLRRRLSEGVEDQDIASDIADIADREYRPRQISETTDRPSATYALVIVNALIWLGSWIMITFLGYDYLTPLGIKDPYWITAGQYWRLLTPLFLHADIMHLAANSFSLVIFGQVVERLFGTRKFLLVYFAAGILGNIASFAFTPARSLGASGAVLGIGGALVYIWHKNKDALYSRRRQYLTLVFLFFFNIVYGLSNLHIDNFAHIGGAVGGYLTAGVLGIRHFRENTDKRLFYAVVALFLALAGLLLGFTKFSGYGYGSDFF